MKFIVNRGVIQMLELIDRSPRLRRMTWALIWIISPVTLSHLIRAIRWW